MNNKIKSLFWNSTESRLRSGWRVVLTWISMLMFFLPVQLLLREVFPDSWSKDQQIDILLFVFGIIATILILVSRVRIDKRPVATLGVMPHKGMFLDIFAGFVISAILVGIVLAVEVGFGWIRFEPVSAGWSAQLSKLIFLLVISGLAVSWWENLFFVSYLFINLRDGCGFRCSFILNCLLFGLIHTINPNATVFAFAGIALIHSYEIFGFLRTKTLWLIFGLHAGWNFFQGLAGFPVSGRGGNQLVSQINTTPAWLGGGEFGPEAGLIVVIVAIAAYSMIYSYSNLRNSKKPEIIYS